MRAMLIIAAFSTLHLCAETKPLPAKIRNEANKIDTRTAQLKHAWHANFEKSVALKNRIATLNDRVSAAKNPANRERFETALAHTKTELAALEEKMDAQRDELSALKTQRGVLTAGIVAKEDAPKSEREGRVEHLGDFGVITYENQAAKEWSERRDENMKKVAAGPARKEKKPSTALGVLGAAGWLLLSGLTDDVDDSDSQIQPRASLREEYNLPPPRAQRTRPSNNR